MWRSDAITPSISAAIRARLIKRSLGNCVAWLAEHVALGPLLDELVECPLVVEEEFGAWLELRCDNAKFFDHKRRQRPLSVPPLM